MELTSVLKNLDVVDVIGKTNIEIEGIKIDTKSIVKGDLFVCLTGQYTDTHKLIKDIKAYGAVAVVVERRVDTTLPQIIVKDTRSALSKLCSNYYSNPEESLKIIGVTGTNGKTTITYMIKNILENAGKKCGVIGTMGAFYGDKKIETGFTTPDPTDLYKILAKMKNHGIEYVIMEVSAHAIFLKKVEYLNFNVKCFSNLTQDHLDYFKDFSTYKEVKKGFLEKKNSKFTVVNSDDEVGVEILKNNQNVLSYGIENPADVFAIDIDENINFTKFTINLFDEIREVKLKIIGNYNVNNAIAAATVTALLGISIDGIIDGLNGFLGVNGRMELVGKKNNAPIFVDYAHTPDGLEKSLTTLKKFCTGRLVSLFGCGGNRDVGKREIMGDISSKIADFTIITSDNPRYEEPMQIISSIERGVLKNSTAYAIIQNRKEAIDYAINSLSDKDVLLIAGKGAEEYQEICSIKHVYNDKDTVIKILKDNYV